jgi:FkbM family methyltransferase
MPSPSLIRRFFRRLGIVVVQESHDAVKYIDAPPATLFDIVLLRVFSNIKGLSFIQIGANDGVRGDPIREKVLNHAWTGLLVEPVPALFEQLKKNYAGLPGLKFVNAAVDVSPGTRAIHFIRPGLPVPDWANGLATFDLGRLQATARELGRHDTDIVHQEIQTLTWNQLLAETGGRRCDVLVVDAEGYDIPLLRAAPLDRWRPPVIQFEHSCAAPGDRLAFYGELIGLGYEIASDGPDTVAWRKADSSQ